MFCLNVMNNQNDKDNLEIFIQIKLEEYKSLKTEIYGRSRDQLNCIRDSLIGVGISLLVGILRYVNVESNTDFNFEDLSVLFLIVNWILLVFGIIWCDSHLTIHRIGKYIYMLENKIFSKLDIKLGIRLDKYPFKKCFSWENYYREIQHQHFSDKIIGKLGFVLPAIYFLFPSILLLMLYWNFNKLNFLSWSTPWSTSFFICNVILLCIFIIYFLKSISYK